MSDLISRQDAIEAIASRDETDGTVKVFTGREVNEILSELPSAEPKAGKWIYGNGHGECSVCHHERQYGWDNYCGNCGAKMRGEEGAE